MRYTTASLCALLALATTAPAMAQTPASEAEPIDWVLSEVPDRKATLAVADFNNGLVLASRCVDGVFEVIISGLPEVQGLTRELQITLNDNHPYQSQWIVGTDKSAAFSRVPVRFARGLAQGGVLQIRVPPYRDQKAIRYILDLPPSVSAVEQTLVACSKSMVDLRYNMLEDEGHGLPQGLDWVERPKPNFPAPTGQMMSTVGYVTVSCGVSEALRPKDCLIESEYPAGFNFGRSVLSSVERGQLRLTNPDVPLTPRATILFNINFRME